MQQEEKTKVEFLLHEENKDLFAYFPNQKNTAVTNVAYSHIGQHSGCSPSYAKESRKATPEEYRDLQKELESIGYNLEILNQ